MVAESGTTTVGTFSYEPTTDRWTWSDGVYAIHGFEPGEVVPTTALVESHQHPEDRPLVRDLLAESIRTGRSGGGAYRLTDARGRERWVALVVEPEDGHPGARIDGRLLDLTVTHARSSSVLANAMLEAATASRAVIDEAKGALMVVYGVDADTAFELLRWYSQHTNLKLRTLAERIVQATGGPVMLPAAVRRDLDGTLFDLSVRATTLLTSPDEHPSVTPGAASTSGQGVAGDPAAAHAPGPPPLRTDLVRLPSATFVHVAGEVNLVTVPALAALLRDATADVEAPARVVVDLTEVTHLGPAGVAELLACHRRCRNAGIRLRLVVGPDGPSVPQDDGGPAVFADLVSAAS